MSDPFTPVNDPAGSYEVPAVAAQSFPNSYHYKMMFEWLPGRTDNKPNFLDARRLPYNATTAAFPGPDAAHPQSPLANPESWERVLRINDTNALANRFPGVQRLMNTIHLALTAMEALQLAEPQLEAANQALAQATTAKQQADTQLGNDQQALTAAQTQLATDQAANPQDPAAIAADQANIDRLTQAVATDTTAQTNAGNALTQATTQQASAAAAVVAIVAQLQ